MFKLKETTELLDHQDVFVCRFVVDEVIGCFDKPGTGKSLEILAAICCTLEEGQKALIVVPPHLMENWLREIEKFTYLELGKDVDLFPYTQLGKNLTSFQGYSFVAADEAHYLKNMDAKRTFNFMTMLEENRPQYFIFATGTPIGNRIPEIYTFLLMIAGWSHVYPKIDAKFPTYYQFCEHFCHVKTVSYGSGVKYHGMKNVDELKTYLKPWTIRRDAPLNVKMKNQTVYADYKEDKALAAAWELHASTGEIGGVDIVAKKESAIAKAPFTSKWVHDALTSEEGPIVVFSDHREPVDIIARDLTKLGWRVGKVMGGGNMKDRDQITLDFQAGKLDVIVSTSAGYTGNTWTKSNLVTVNDLPWRPDDLDQLRKRVLRLSQERECRCVYIAGSRADDQIITMLTAKLKVINAVIEA